MPNPNMRFARDGVIGGCLTCYFKAFLYLLVTVLFLAVTGAAVFIWYCILTRHAGGA